MISRIDEYLTLVINDFEDCGDGWQEGIDEDRAKHWMTFLGWWINGKHFITISSRPHSLDIGQQWWEDGAEKIEKSVWIENGFIESNSRWADERRQDLHYWQRQEYHCLDWERPLNASIFRISCHCTRIVSWNLNIQNLEVNIARWVNPENLVESAPSATSFGSPHYQKRFGPRKRRTWSKSMSKIATPFNAKKIVSSLVIGFVGVKSP